MMGSPPCSPTMEKWYDLDPVFREIHWGEPVVSNIEAQAMLPKVFLQESKLVRWRRATVGVLYFAVGLTVGACLGTLYVTRSQSLDQRCIEHISEVSPVVKELDMTFGEKHFNGSLFDTSDFRKDAGPEVDAAWKSLGVDYRPAIISDKVAASSGFEPTFVRVNSKYGGGYTGNVEGLQHLQCLNLLRQSLYFNFDHYFRLGEGAFGHGDNMLKYQVTHCVDMLRQQLMCNVDVGVSGQIWWNKKDPQAYPDRNTKHVCRNFEAVRSWAEAHQTPAEVPNDYLAPPLNEEAVYASIP